MNKKGFTLVELLATLVILGIVVGITIVTVNSNYGNAKKKTEGIFVKTLEDALDIYLDTSEVKGLNYVADANNKCILKKTHGESRLYRATKNKQNTNLTFNDVLNSEYVPLVASELVNPANKDNDNYNCDPSNGTLTIYRDDDFVYYYKLEKKNSSTKLLGCLNDTGIITNLPALPSGCNW